MPRLLLIGAVLWIASAGFAAARAPDRTTPTAPVAPFHQQQAQPALPLHILNPKGSAPMPGTAQPKPAPNENRKPRVLKPRLPGSPYAHPGKLYYA